MQPDFSPRMLRLFLAGQAARLAGENGLTPKAARADLSQRLRRAAGVGRDDLAAAFAGRLDAASPRTRLWAALGHFPADHGLVLSDDGGQTATGQPATAGRASRREAANGVGAKARAAKPATAGRASRREAANGVGAKTKDSAHG